jgi:hypothetical protein
MKPVAAVAAACLLALRCACAPAAAQDVFEYRGICDASAAVALGADHFVVADDERNTLQVYRRAVASAVASVDVSAFLGTKADKESDLEGAASIGTRIYWISSHGRNSKAEEQERRHRFFATQVDTSTAPPSLKPVGSAYAGLLGDLIAAPALKAFKLRDAAASAPEAAGGLNIEGLAATPEGRLLIGFRNPIPHGKALVVALENPADLVAGQGAKPARFGAPLLLDLGGRGIRSIERVGSGYLIVAGPSADAGTFALYRWSGKAGEGAVPVRGVDFRSLRPEALFQFPGTSVVQVLSDDGGVETGGVACKKLPPAQRAFRSIVLTP